MGSVRFFKAQNYAVCFFIILQLFFPFLIVSSSFPQAKKSETAKTAWETKKSTHFFVYYEEKFTPGYIADFILKAERYYETITKKFGFRRFNFWTWDKRCKIYLYSSREDYYNNTGRPHWSSASANIRTREINAFISGGHFSDAILAHEMAHLVFREFVGYDTYAPLWLDEGIATSVEGGYKAKRLNYAKQLVETGVFIPLDTLTKIKPQSLILPDMFYAQSASIIEFLLEEYGREKFVYFCRAIRDGDSWNAALEKAYGFKSLAEMDGKWQKFLLK